MKTLFENIFELLKTPNSTNAVDSTIAALLLENKEEYDKKVEENSLANANKPIAELMKELMGDTIKEEDDAYK